MTTSAITSALSSGNAAAKAKDMSELTSDDFLKLLVEELTQQDPFEPMKNQDLMNQINTIREMEMNTSLNDTLSAFALKTSLSAAAGVIGKSVAGLTDSGSEAVGVVTGVRVRDNQVLLDLDTGQSLRFENIKEIYNDPTSAEAQAAALEAAVGPNPNDVGEDNA